MNEQPGPHFPVGPAQMVGFELDPSGVRDLSPDVLDDHGRMRVLPSAFWATTTPRERALFGHYQGIYSFPTTELVDHLRDLIGGQKAIEIGAGHGVLAEALGIPATDSRMQEKAKYRRIYQQTGQPTVKYGANVVELDAHAAVSKYRPDVVIGCWVTHKFDPKRAWAAGNEVGIDEEDVLAHCRRYVVIGNGHVHAAKSIWSRTHLSWPHSFLYSRATNGTPDFLATWRGTK